MYDFLLGIVAILRQDFLRLDEGYQDKYSQLFNGLLHEEGTAI